MAAHEKRLAIALLGADNVIAGLGLGPAPGRPPTARPVAIRQLSSRSYTIALACWRANSYSDNKLCSSPESGTPTPNNTG